MPKMKAYTVFEDCPNYRITALISKGLANVCGEWSEALQRQDLPLLRNTLSYALGKSMGTKMIAHNVSDTPLFHMWSLI